MYMKEVLYISTTLSVTEWMEQLDITHFVQAFDLI